MHIYYLSEGSGRVLENKSKDQVLRWRLAHTLR